MKVPPLEYVKVARIEEAFEILGADEDAKVIAGGQSLMPLLALRLARPTVLVDVTGLPHAELELADGELHIGALVRQRRLELDPLVASAAPLLADAVRQVGYPSTRNRGTIGGTLAHGDPVAELPAVAVALGGRVEVAGAAGARSVACAELSDGFFTTVLAPDEIITAVVVPAASARHGAAWCEWAPRAHDFAQAGAGVAVDLDTSGAVAAVHAGACALGGGPVDLGPAVAVLLGQHAATPAALRAVAAAVEAVALDAGGDELARLTGLLAARAARLAIERAAA